MTPVSRYQSTFCPGTVKDETLDSDGENDEKFVSNPFEAYKDSGCESLTYLENNSVKHYSVSSSENPLGPTCSQHFEERRDQIENKTKSEPLTPTGTPIKNLPFSPSQVGFYF